MPASIDVFMAFLLLRSPYFNIADAAAPVVSPRNTKKHAGLRRHVEGWNEIPAQAARAFFL
jgi:hypothetical protein